MIKIYLILCVFLFACEEPCYNGYYLNITNYEFHTTSITTLGVRICDYTGKLNLDLIDQKIIEFERCTGIKVKYDCIKVLVPPDIYTSYCSGQELFPCNVNPQLCIDKGAIPNKDCPCNCRGAIQDNNIIVTVPSLITFKVELARMVTYINNPYKDDVLKGCI